MAPEDSDQDPSTRKQRRDAARQQRKAAEAAQAAAEGRRRRLIQLGSVGVAVIVIIVVIVAVTSGGKGGGGTGGVPQTKNEKSAARGTVVSLLAGVPQSGNVLGSPNAPVTMHYFGDLECSVCQAFTLNALPNIIANDVRTGKLKIEYRSLETATSQLGPTRGPEFFRRQQVAAYAAGRQDKAWYYIELFYHEQGEEGVPYANEAYLQGLAQQVPGLNLTQWTAARGEKALETKVLDDEREAIGLGFKGTPSFTIGKSGGQLRPFEPASVLESGSFEEEVSKLAA